MAIPKRPRPLRDSDPYTWNLGLLLFFVIILQFGQPVTMYGELWTGLYMLLYAAMIFFGIRLVRHERQPLSIVATVGIAFVAFGTWFSFDQEHRTATLGMLVSLTVFMLMLVIALTMFIFRRSHAAGVDLVLAAVTVYLLHGGLFGAAYSVMEILHPGSFADPTTPGASPTWRQLVYYSYVTMSTVGYGEVLPLTAWARSLAAFQAVAGTLFLTVAVARLVSIWRSSNPVRPDT
ncbi:ion channel [Phytoactinopolyspora halotolerans]|uniref:Two pore domain potassium channel family protein n=1 Tax=Phytoactinopolyspora halotolerans TaxID=1981512 RepID=A0A6L9SL09_9ACTN|nr:ion channel [Phytoactinopolyspora halotolerans]NEE04730.1 two pore domain potassium channel family protein [Phytoactinopolyspora halotolerans]